MSEGIATENQDKPQESWFYRILTSDKFDKKVLKFLVLLAFCYLAVGFVLSLILPQRITVNGYYYEIFFALLFVALVLSYLKSLSLRAKRIKAGGVFKSIISFSIIIFIVWLVSTFLSGCLATNTPKWPECKTYSKKHDKYYYLNTRFVLAGGGEIWHRLLSSSSLFSPVWSLEQDSNRFNYDMYGTKDCPPSELELSGDESLIAVKHQGFYTDVFSTRTQQRLLRQGLDSPETEKTPSNDKIIREMLALRDGNSKPLKKLTKAGEILAFENLSAKLNNVLPDAFKEKYPDFKIQISTGLDDICFGHVEYCSSGSEKWIPLSASVNCSKKGGLLVIDEIVTFTEIAPSPTKFQKDQKEIYKFIRENVPIGTLVSPN